MTETNAPSNPDNLTEEQAKTAIFEVLQFQEDLVNKIPNDDTGALERPYFEVMDGYRKRMRELLATYAHLKNPDSIALHNDWNEVLTPHTLEATVITARPSKTAKGATITHSRNAVVVKGKKVGEWLYESVTDEKGGYIDASNSFNAAPGVEVVWNEHLEGEFWAERKRKEQEDHL
jgi:hypothetical protein